MTTHPPSSSALITSAPMLSFPHPVTSATLPLNETPAAPAATLSALERWPASFAPSLETAISRMLSK